MPNGQPRRSLDASRARELFGFEARTPLREGLERTIAWYREHAGAIAAALLRELADGLGARPARRRRRRRRLRRARELVLLGPRRRTCSECSSSCSGSPCSRSPSRFEHNGWLYLLRRRPALALHRRLRARPPATSRRRSSATAGRSCCCPVTCFAGPNLVSALPAIVLFNTLVLLPVALLCVYGDRDAHRGTPLRLLGGGALDRAALLRASSSSSRATTRSTRS